MGVFRDFEIQALRLLLSPALSPDQMQVVEMFTGPAEYEYTGSGYFLTIQDARLPEEKSTCSEPAVVGEDENVRCGFVAFLGEHQLVLECHTWGAVDVPEGFRNCQVRISTPKITRIGDWSAAT